MGMFDDYSLEEASKKFKEFLNSKEFKEMAKDFFDKLTKEE